MGGYILRRLLTMVPTLFLISIVTFVIIQLPPGDFLTSVVARLSAQGQNVDSGQLEALRERYALDQPFIAQYWRWITNIFQGDFGQSFEHGKAVSTLLAERLPLTIGLSVTAVVLSWLVALPLGIYSAVRKYSVGDYIVTALAFLGIAVPGFLLALTIAYLQARFFGFSPGGLFSPEYADAAWNLGKVLDLLAHLWAPILVLSAAGIAGTVRVLRASLLDELHKPYVVTARSKGLGERTLILRYPVRIALNPFISTAGWVLPTLVGGEVIVAKVLSLQTTGPLLLGALESQDMFLAGSIIMILSVLTVVGTLISDIVLAAVDPRIRAGYA